LSAKYDGTVRTGNNMILQYIYSDFNLDQTKQKTIKVLNLQVVKVITDKNILVVAGSVPGAKGSYLIIKK
jgi:hypothetical protein